MGESRIACAQTVPVAGDVEANVQQHLDLIRATASESPDAIVFPELSLTGYELDLADRLAFDGDDRRLEPLRLAGATQRVTLIVGAPIRQGGKLYNGAFILRPGAETLIHCKRYLGTFGEEARVDGELPPAEASVFVPGEPAPLFAAGERAAAIAICAEGNRPQHAQDAAARGASAYLASSFVIPSEYEEATRNLRQRALDHRMLVAFANFSGSSGGLRSAGASATWAPDGTLLGKLPKEGAGILLAVASDDQWTAVALSSVGVTD